MENNLHIATMAVHGGARKDDTFGAINEPIYMTSNYRIPTDGTPVDWSGIHSNIYQRNRNVNQMVLQEKLCALTGAEDGAVFASGVAALAAVFTTTLNSGDHAIVSEVCYSATNLLFREYLPKKYGVEVTLLDTTDTEAVRAAVRPNTKLIHVESPGSILYDVIDLPKLCKIAHAHNIPVAIDNTYSSGYLYNPLKLGADISVIAATKYLSGHSDVTMGVVVCNEKEWKNFDKLPEALGFTTSPDDCYLVLRGMRTLAVRMNQIEKNTDEVVAYLQTRPEIKTIFYPKLPTHPNHDIFMRDYKGASGMLTIEFADGYTKEDAVKFTDALKYFACGASWGGYESLATVTVPPRTATDWSKRGPFVRFHIGLEDAQDLIEDLGQALDKISHK